MGTAAIWPALDYGQVLYRLYHDAEPYACEQERIFCGPVWNFLGLAAKIPNPGDLRASYVGDTLVIFQPGSKRCRQSLCQPLRASRRAGARALRQRR